MPLTGDFQTFSLSALGRLLHLEKKTGILQARCRDHETRIYFREGTIVFVSGALPAAYSLGALLKEQQLLSEREIKELLEIARRETKRLACVLMEKGKVPQEKLVQMLHYQFREAVSFVLTWHAGTFAYEDGLKGFVEDVPLKLNPARFIAEAEKWKVYRSIIPSEKAVFRIKDKASPTDALSTNATLRVMLLLDGKRDVSQIIAASRLPRLGVYRAIAGLVEQGIIERFSAAATPHTGPWLDPSSMVLYFLHILHETTRLIALDLGLKKAHIMLEESLLRSFEDKFLAEAVVPGAGPEVNARRFFERQQRRNNPLDGRQLELCFKSAVTSLLQAEYHVLGLKAVRDTICRLEPLVENLEGGGPQAAGHMLTFLRSIAQDEGCLNGGKRS